MCPDCHTELTALYLCQPTVKRLTIDLIDDQPFLRGEVTYEQSSGRQTTRCPHCRADLTKIAQAYTVPFTRKDRRF